MRKLNVSLLSLVILILAACAAPATPIAPTATPPPAKTGVIRWYDISNFDVRDVPMRMALDALRAEGYTVEEIYMDSSTLIAEAFARGEADIAWTNNQTMWAAIEKGAGVITVAQATGFSTSVIATKEIQSCSDLDGGSIAVAGANILSTNLLKRYLQENCPEAEIQTIVIGENAARIAALMGGEVSASMMQSEGLLRMEADAPGQFHELVALGKEFPDIQIEGIHVRREWAEQNPQIVRDFIKAMLLQNRAVVDNPELLYTESSKRLDLPPDQAKAIADAYLAINLWDVNGGFTNDKLQATIDFLVSIESLVPETQIEDVVDLSYLNTVLDEIGRK
jgi:ABC-type nitrate/sulfonate/bicarbonate transport system substrate-binding protein